MTPTPSPHARLGAWHILFRALAGLGGLEIIALALSLVQRPDGVGILGQGLVLRIWLGLVVGLMLLLFGGFIDWRLRGHVTGRVMILMALGVVAMQYDYSSGMVGAALAADAVILYSAGLAVPSLGYLMLTFPTGRIYPPGWRRAVIAASIIKFGGVLLEILASPGRI